MIFSLAMPRAGAEMQQGTIHKLIAKPGDALKPGTPILEVRVDLGASKAQDCPPLFFFRLIATERGVLRTLQVAQGQLVDVGATLGVVSSTADEDATATPTRAVRTTSVAVQVDPLSR